MISIHHDNSDNLDYTFSLVLVTKIRDVNSTWPLCDKGELLQTTCQCARTKIRGLEPNILQEGLQPLPFK